MSFGQTPVSTTSLSQNQFPVSAVAVPNETGGNLTALEGGPESTDSNGNKTAPVSMYVKDGGNVTQGTSTDANTVNSMMGRLTKIRDLLNATLTVGGTITEANSASIKSDLDAINTAIGAISDAAWGGSGNGSEIAILKKIVAELAATLTVSGTVTANAGSGTFTNQQSNITIDYDTGAGTQNLTMFGVALPASGGAVSGGTSNNPLRTDPTGTTTQPVSGTITANAGTGNFNDASVASTGAAVPASASYLAGNKSGNLTGISLDGSGNLNVNVAAGGASGGTSSTYGSTFPSTGTAIGASDGTNMQALQVESSSNKNLRVALYNGSTEASVTGSNALKVDGSSVTQPVSGTITANAGTGTFTNQQSNNTADYDTGAGTQTMTLFGVALPASGGAVAGGTSTNPLRTDPTGTTTQPISGIITANIGTTNGVALDTSVNGVIVAQGSSTSGEKGPLIQGAVTTSAPTYTTAQTSPISLTTSGAMRVDNSANTQPVSGTITANAGSGSFTVTQATGSNLHTVIDAGSAVIGHVIADSGSTTAVTQATASNLNAQVVGSVASGASNAGNPVKDGGVFNTTQPTVTNGQVVDAQYTARGAAIVATGVDSFAVNASQSGTWNVNNVSGTVSLPTGAATSAKQPALGTAGSASADVMTVQGITSMTAIKTDGSGVTQPVSGTVSITANSAVNVAQVAGATTSTAASGVQKVGIVGNSGATVDSTIGAGTAPTNAIVTGSIYNSSAPAPTSGQSMALQADQAGNIRTFPGIALATLSAWNSGTSLNATQNIFTNSGAESVLVQLTQTTTLSAGAITFEVTYDGSNWSTIPASAALDPTSTTFAQISLPYTVQASTNKTFLLNMNGAQGLRVKLSTQITGSGSVTPNYALLPASPADTVVALSPTAANFNVTASAGTNLNTSLLAVESGGNLATLAGGVTSSKYQANMAQLAGTTTDTNSGNKSAGTLRVVLATDQPALTNKLLVTPDSVALPANQSVNVAQINGVTTTMGNGVSGTGVQRVTIASDSTGVLGATQSGTWTVQPGNTANTTAWLVQSAVGTAGGSTPYHNVVSSGTNGTNVKASAGQIYDGSISNTSSSAVYFRLYDTSGTPTVGTTTTKRTIQVPGNGTVIFSWPNGLKFTSGIAWGVTTAIADNDTTAISAAVSIDFGYN